MSKHLWMQDLSVAAYCPKCNAPDFKRSNTRSDVERLVRRFSTRTPYRCHKCSYRTLVDQTKLRYPAVSHKEFEDHEDFSSKIEVPDVGINSIDSRVHINDLEIQPDVSADKENTVRDMPEPFSSGNEEKPTEDMDVRADDSEKLLSSLFPKIDERSVNVHYEDKVHGIGKHRHSTRCPSCGEFALHRSHARTLYEGLRKKVTSKRIFRCHDCDWRGWVHKSF